MYAIRIGGFASLLALFLLAAPPARAQFPGYGFGYGYPAYGYGGGFPGFGMGYGVGYGGGFPGFGYGMPGYGLGYGMTAPWYGYAAGFPAVLPYGGPMAF